MLGFSHCADCERKLRDTLFCPDCRACLCCWSCLTRHRMNHNRPTPIPQPRQHPVTATPDRLQCQPSEPAPQSLVTMA
jgi:hypothetical protein